MAVRGIMNGLRRVWLDQAGAFALIFAFSLPAVFAGAGMAVDMAQAYNVKTRLSNALDKAALAAGSTSGDIADIEDRVERFIEANYRDDNVIGQAFNVNVTLGDGTVTVTASAMMETAFMGVLGVDTIEITESTTVRREMSGVEAVLVLDVTGSMEGYNITSLKSAARKFIEIMFDRISDVDYLRIGIVPFSGTVNVGPYGLGEDPDGEVYATPFVVRPGSDSYMTAANIEYSSAASTHHWRGCIRERSSPNDTNDAANPSTWQMYRYPKSSSNNNPNLYCPNSPIVPLNNDEGRLTAAINNLQVEGPTYINLGLIWGWRVISPTAPFTEGVAYNHPDWTKTVILMTDGNNSIWNTYSAYGANPGLSNTNLNTKTTTVCNAMKAGSVGIRIYTIVFAPNPSDVSATTRNLMRSCASDTTKYFEAASQATLENAFTQIANELSQLHITD